MNKINWTQVLAFGLVVLVVFLVGLSLLPMLFGGYGWPGMMGRGMMSGWYGGSAPFGPGWMMGGFLGPIFMVVGMLFPLGLLALLILGILWLARNLGGAPATALTCPHCGRPVQADWQNCPYCGEPLGREG